MTSRPDDGEGDFGGIEHGPFRNHGEIVAVEADIEDADRDFTAFEALDLGRQSLRERHAAPPDSDEGEFVEIGTLFQDLVRQPDQCPVNLRGAHQLLFLAGNRHADSQSP